jgi:hypothetical protein
VILLGHFLFSDEVLVAATQITALDDSTWFGMGRTDVTIGQGFRGVHECDNAVVVANGIPVVGTTVTEAGVVAAAPLEGQLDTTNESLVWTSSPAVCHAWVRPHDIPAPAMQRRAKLEAPAAPAVTTVTGANDTTGQLCQKTKTQRGDPDSLQRWPTDTRTD